MKRGHPDVTEGGISLPLLTLEMEQGRHPEPSERSTVLSTPYF